LLHTHSLVPGGSERQWCYLARELARRGYTTTLLVNSLAGEQGHYLPLLDGSGVTVLSVNTFRAAGALWHVSGVPEGQTEVMKLAYAMRECRPTHVLCQLDTSNLQGATAALSAECGVEKILLSFRNMNPGHFPPYYDETMLPWYKELLRSKRIVLSGNSRAGNADYASWLGIAQERIAYIPNALPDEFPVPRPRDAVRAELGIAQGSPVLLGVFRLSAEKNPELFLTVARRLRERFPGLVVLHAGVGPLEAEIRGRAAAMGLAGVMRFLERRTDIPDLMGAADLLLLCSNREGMPNVLLEAQRMGLLVVTTAAGGVPDAVRDGETALLAAPGDADALEGLCSRLLEDARLRRTMGEAGRLFASAAFSQAALGDATLRLLGLPETGGSAPSGDAPGKHGLTLHELEPRLTLADALRHIGQQVLCLLPEDEHEALAANLPDNCVCIHSGKREIAVPGIVFDWERQRDWSSLRKAISPGMAACLFSSRIPGPRLRRRLRALGITHAVVCDDGEIFRLPTDTPGVWRRISNLGRLLFTQW
jgi:glycosyltransferase involved in cell wall biosynthesis